MSIKWHKKYIHIPLNIKNKELNFLKIKKIIHNKKYIKNTKNSNKLQPILIILTILNPIN
jgi:hypothetical protein